MWPATDQTDVRTRKIMLSKRHETFPHFLLTMAASTTTKNNNLLEPPAFELPSDFESNRDDYELWSVRVPAKFDMSALNNVTLPFDMEEDVKGRQDATITSFEHAGQSYGFVLGHAYENNSFRILKPCGDSQDTKEMQPLPFGFDRQINMVSTSQSHMTDIDLAPSSERAPAIDMGKEKMRIPYVPIPQKQGLKRRWNVCGANSKGGIGIPSDESPMKKEKPSHDLESKVEKEKTPKTRKKSEEKKSKKSKKSDKKKSKKSKK